MKHRCNGCGSLYNGRACGICQSANEVEPEDFDEFAPAPVRPSSGAPMWFVAVLFFVVGMMFAAALFIAASPRR